MCVIAGGRVRRQRDRVLAQGAVRGREIRRAAEQLREGRPQDIQGRVGGLPGRERLAFTLRVAHVGAQDVVEALGQIARHAPLELGGQCREFGLVGLESGAPLLLGLGALVAHVPGRADLGGNLERRRRPAEPQPGRGDLLVAHGLAVHGSRALLVRRAPADRGLGANQRRFVAHGAGGRQGLGDGLAILAVHVWDDVPAVGLESHGRVVREPALNLAVDRNAVVVVDRDQLAELLHAREGGRFVRHALHHASVAHEHIGMVIDDGMARAIEGGGERPLGERHAHRVRKSLPKGAGRGLDPEVQFALRVPGRLGAPLPKILDLIHRQRISGEVKHRIEQHGRMPVGEHEPVAVQPERVGRIELKHLAPQHLRDVGHAQGGARMARIGLLDGIHRQGADGVGELATRGHGGLLFLERGGIVPDAPPSINIGIYVSICVEPHSHKCSLVM